MAKTSKLMYFSKMMRNSVKIYIFEEFRIFLAKYLWKIDSSIIFLTDYIGNLLVYMALSNNPLIS